MIAYNNFYHLVEVKRTKKFGAQIWAFFLLFSQAWFISYLLNCIGDSLEQFLDTSRGKLHKKKMGCPNLGHMGQNRAQN